MRFHWCFYVYWFFSIKCSLHCSCILYYLYFRADSLYLFFIEWRPDLYGEEISDKEVLNSRGFVAISSEQQQCDTERNNKPKLPCSPLVRQLSKSRVFKDWEVRLTQNIRVLEFLILTRQACDSYDFYRLLSYFKLF